MSWFSSIAGKAEQILNQLDEAAATSLKDAGLATPTKTPPTQKSSNYDDEQSTGLSYEPIAQPTTTPPPRRPLSTSSSSTWASSSSWSAPPPLLRTTSGSRSFTNSGRGEGRSQTNDESLMEFLNSPSLPREKKKTTPTIGQPVIEERIKNRKNNTSKESNNHTGKSHDITTTITTSTRDETPPILPLSTTPPPSDQATPTVISLQPSQDNRTDQSTQPVLVNKQEERETRKEKGEGGEEFNFENQRLREEIKSLTDELFIMKQQVGDNGRIEGQLRADITSLRTQCTQLEELTNRMKSQEDDLKSTLEARESQINILRTRLHESDQLTQSLRLQLETAERKNDQFLQDVGKSNDAQNQALLSVKTQLEQTELLLEQEKENSLRLEEECKERQVLWSKEREEMVESLNVQGKELQLQQLRYSECANTLQSTKHDLQRVQKEHQEYKIKASGILQAKEKLIDSLRHSSTGSDSDRTLETSLEEVRTEKYQLQSQLVNSEQVILSLRTELQEIEDSHTMEHEQLLQQIKLIEEELEKERNSHLTTQDEVIALQRELDTLKDEHVKERASFMSKMREKDETIGQLTKKVTSSSDQSDSSKKYLEERLRELTESLIEKQTNLEILSSQHTSTKLQLERAETNLVEAQKRVTPQPSHTALELGEEGGVGTHMRPMASILPTSDVDNPVRQRHLRRVRTTLDSVDKVGLRLAWVLRRYPYVRLFVLGYILLLHIWVMVVLFTYKPEIHDDH